MPSVYTRQSIGVAHAAKGCASGDLSRVMLELPTSTLAHLRTYHIPLAERVCDLPSCQQAG